MASLAEEYQSGCSLSDLSAKHGIPKPTIRSRLAKLGLLRTRAEGVRIAAQAGKLSLPKQRNPMSDSTKAKIKEARLHWGETHAAGVSLKASGYVEYTRGPNKGRSAHVVLMEERLGRRILPDEVVHHIDGNRANNNINNLALMTRDAHTRLHRFEDALANKKRERATNGRFS